MGCKKEQMCFLSYHHNHYLQIILVCTKKKNVLISRWLLSHFRFAWSSRGSGWNIQAQSCSPGIFWGEESILFSKVGVIFLCLSHFSSNILEDPFLGGGGASCLLAFHLKCFVSLMDGDCSFLQSDLKRLTTHVNDRCRNTAFSLIMRYIHHSPRWAAFTCMIRDLQCWKSLSTRFLDLKDLTELNCLHMVIFNDQVLLQNGS